MKPDRKQISAALIEHLEREELHTGEAAKYLNLNPCYISMAKSEKSWDAMSTTAWNRLEEWFNTRENIKDFKIPEGEEIWKKPERDPSTRITEPDVTKVRKERKSVDEHSPENLVHPKFPPDRVESHKDPSKKEKPGKSVNLIIYKAELEALRKLVDENYKACNGVFDKFNDAFNKMDVAYSEKFAELAMKLEVSEAKYNNLLDVFREHEIRLNNLQSHPSKNGQKPSKGIVIFQRNYFKS